MALFKVLTVFLVSAPIFCGAQKSRISVDPPVNDNPCATNPCLNDGRCTPSSSTEVGYFCQCTIGFYGANCNAIDDALTLQLLNIGEKDLDYSPTDFELATQVDPICNANPCQRRENAFLIRVPTTLDMFVFAPRAGLGKAAKKRRKDRLVNSSGGSHPKKIPQSPIVYRVRIQIGLA